MKICLIGGVPAVGKSTLVRKFFNHYLSWQDFKYKKLYGHYNSEINLLILGIYNQNVFSGTDRLSMAVQPDFNAFLQKNNKYNILFEGDRLFNNKTLQNIPTKYEQHIIILQSKFTEQRHKERNDNQTEKFLKGRETKIKNLKQNIKNFILLDNDNENDMKKNFEYIISKMIKNE